MFEPGGGSPQRRALSLSLCTTGAIDSLRGAGAPQNPAGIRCIPRPCCPFCGKQGEPLYAALLDWASGVPGSWGFSTCPACGIAWLDPQPVAEDIPRLYASRYYTHGPTARTRFDRIREKTRHWALRRMGYGVEPEKGVFPRILSHLRSNARAAALDVMDLPASEVGSLLDVGCGNGEFLLRMRSLGWNVSGMDPDPVAASHGRSEGLQVFCGTISDVPETICYDAITLSHVIEHAPDPVELLRECRKRLCPDTGRLVVTTPNINSLGHRWFRKYWRGLETPRHLNLFSPDGFSQCAVRAGLRVVTLTTEARMARVLYVPSVYGKRGERNVAERLNFKTSTKIASYGFQFLEDALIRLMPDVGEEIFCVCAVPANP